MAGERIRLEVEEREERGSRESRRLRRDGMIPGVLYGRGNKPHPICVPERELRRVLTGSAGLHAILDVVLEGQKSTHASILKDYQVDPIRGKIEHFDLQEVRLDQPIQTSVVVELVGESVGTKAGGFPSRYRSGSSWMSARWRSATRCGSPTCLPVRASRTSTMPRRPSSPR